MFVNHLPNSLTLIYIFALNILNLCPHLLIFKYICQVLLVYIVKIICWYDSLYLFNNFVLPISNHLLFKLFTIFSRDGNHLCKEWSWDLFVSSWVVVMLSKVYLFDLRKKLIILIISSFELIKLCKNLLKIKKLFGKVLKQ